MIGKILPIHYISFKSKFDKIEWNQQEWDNIPNKLDEKYTDPKMTSNMFTVCGDANDNPHLDTELCSSVTRTLVGEEKMNALNGCGTKGGIMKSTFFAALTASIKGPEGEPLQHFVMVTDPPWKDERIGKKYCIPIAKFASEEQRAEGFWKASDIGIFFPGGFSTDKELFVWLRNTAKYIKKMKETKEPTDYLKQTILVGNRKLFKPLLDYLNKKFEMDLIDASPQEMVTILDKEEDIIEAVKKFRTEKIKRFNKII